MIICEVCGNDISSSCRRCPFCGAEQSGGRAAPPRKGITPPRNVNLEAGMPAVDEGMERLERALQEAGREGVRILRVIHGYGSTGSGGKLKKACRALLRRKTACKQIRSFLPGEDYSESTRAGKALIKRHPLLSRTEYMDRRNPGITFVEL